ncbi:uncharacterized protein LOC132058772 [Lycium ferocissimum]|uniref:uncharacterized protein LOC132058772 n=1 Tax=Lycium ferocissimum TaxID=112874 RepID=UPI00281602E5|nr:uncharacterized protein LOC132058772 [Lycium ferocissimum]XP_059307096.1 uncharacterized protein LOC132058772 [Lycium ferocissimum]XP_059307102.1 uncharacterized protein LOC132058772 [Lycium ferocissimum]XP_059307115.1 uncharacterized protein LOC132058772 [Lycium ferocissimum]
MDAPVKKPQDNGQKTSTDADILAKRLKNRERQRRYRERKRLKADTMKVSETNQLALLPVDVPVIAAPQDSKLPMNAAPLDSSVPVNVAPLDSSVLVNIAPLDSSMSVNVAPRAYAMPVDVASGECVKPVRGGPRDSVTTRVYSGRKWKRDARKAHAVRQKEVSTNSTVLPDLASTGGVERSDVALSNVISSPVTALINNGTPKSIPSRRNWKAEARNKKS